MKTLGLFPVAILSAVIALSLVGCGSGGEGAGTGGTTQPQITAKTRALKATDKDNPPDSELNTLGDEGYSSDGSSEPADLPRVKDGSIWTYGYEADSEQEFWFEPKSSAWLIPTGSKSCDGNQDRFRTELLEISDAGATIETLLDKEESYAPAFTTLKTRAGGHYLLRITFKKGGTCELLYQKFAMRKATGRN